MYGSRLTTRISAADIGTARWYYVWMVLGKVLIATCVYSHCSRYFCSLTLREQSSNVVRFCSMLKKGDKSRQLVYYQSGVGTFLDPSGSHSTLLPSVSLALDQAFAWNLPSHIKGGLPDALPSRSAHTRTPLDGYKFLMQNCASSVLSLREIALSKMHTRLGRRQDLPLRLFPRSVRCASASWNAAKGRIVYVNSRRMD